MPGRWTNCYLLFIEREGEILFFVIEGGVGGGSCFFLKRVLIKWLRTPPTSYGLVSSGFLVASQEEGPLGLG